MAQSRSRQKHRSDVLFPLYCLALSGLFLLLASKSSPLYPLNDWPDANCFMTMGRSILEGRVPYRDLYEQKGPLLYFLYAFFALISPGSFRGVYVGEALAFALFLYFSGRILGLYCPGERPRCLAVLLLAAGIPVSRAFSHGGSAEELQLWCLSLSLWLVLRASRQEKPPRFRDGFIIGLCFSVALWTKYTICGFYLGLVIFTVILYISRKWELFDLLWIMTAFLLGLLALTLPIFLYFGLNHALPQLLEVYFVNNITLYRRSAHGVLYYTRELLRNALAANIHFSAWLQLGVLFLFWRLSEAWREGVAVLLSFLLLCLTTYGGGRSYSYYALILSPFALFGLIVIFCWLKDKIALPKRKPLRSKVLFCVFLLGVCFLSLRFVGKYSGNSYLRDYAKEDLPQYQFAETVTAVPDSSLLNYGFLDGGFYFAADRLPVTRAFCGLNIPFQELKEEQNRLVENGLVTFVVTRGHLLFDYGIDASRYCLVQEAELELEGYPYHYYLWQLEE